MVPQDLKFARQDCDEWSVDRLTTVTLDETDDIYRQGTAHAPGSHHARTQTDLSEDLVLTGMY